MISGYLMTFIVARQTSTIQFYSRRIKRIFPTCLLVLGASLVAGLFVLLPSDFAFLKTEALWSAFFINNFSTMFSEKQYFELVSFGFLSQPEHQRSSGGATNSFSGFGLQILPPHLVPRSRNPVLSHRSISDQLHPFPVPPTPMDRSHRCSLGGIPAPGSLRIRFLRINVLQNLAVFDWDCRFLLVP